MEKYMYRYLNVKLSENVFQHKVNDLQTNNCPMNYSLEICINPYLDY